MAFKFGKKKTSDYKRMTGCFPVQDKKGRYFGKLDREHFEEMLVEMTAIFEACKTIGVTVFINPPEPGKPRVALTYVGMDEDEAPKKKPGFGKTSFGGKKPYKPKAQAPIEDPIEDGEEDPEGYQVEDYNE